LTVIRDDTPGRQVIFMGAGADLDIEAAIFHSLLEGLRAGYWSLVAEEKIVEADKKAPLVENIKERKAFWCDRSRLSEADFLFEGPLKRAAKNEYSGAGYNVKLRRLKEIFKARGMDVYAVDCTTAIANEFGLKIMMVLAPELCYLYLDERFKYLGAKRLYEAPVKMGIFNESKKEEEMNAVPHPFL
jgi:ribosomal protein S12 methylthiotransferase accessory factor